MVRTLAVVLSETGTPRRVVSPGVTCSGRFQRTTVTAESHGDTGQVRRLLLRSRGGVSRVLILP